MWTVLESLYTSYLLQRNHIMIDSVAFTEHSPTQVSREKPFQLRVNRNPIHNTYKDTVYTEKDSFVLQHL